MAVNGMEHSHKMEGQASNSLVRDETESSSYSSHMNTRNLQKMNALKQGLQKASEQQKLGYSSPGLGGHALGSESMASASDVTTTLLPPKSKKGSSFMITKVVKTSTNEDNDDGELDETNTEDVSSMSLDVSKTTDIEQDPSSEDTVYGDSHGVSEERREQAQTSHDSIILQQNHQPMAMVSTIPIETIAKTSATEMEGPRFQIVRVDNTASSKYQRGRWTCYDYLDERTEKPNSNEKGSGNSSASSSFHYAPGVDDPTRNPFMTTTVANGHSNITTVPSSVANGKVGASTQPQNPSQALPTIVSQAAVPSTQFENTAPIQFIGSQATHQPSQPPASQQGQLATQTQSNTQVPPPQQNVPPSSIAMEGIASSSQQPQPVGTSAVSASVPLSQNVTTTATSVSNTSPNMENIQQSGTGMVCQDFKQINVALDNLVLQGTKQESSASSDRPAGGSDGIDRLYAGSAVGFPGEAFDVAMVRAMTQGPYSGQASGKEEDESGASTVAIDNKIEQAMDLVKSHLMFAVREEVEVLKEQIKELLEKNSQLECENNILKAAATADTLAKLSQKSQQSQPPTLSS